MPEQMPCASALGYLSLKMGSMMRCSMIPATNWYRRLVDTAKYTPMAMEVSNKTLRASMLNGASATPLIIARTAPRAPVREVPKAIATKTKVKEELMHDERLTDAKNKKFGGSFDDGEDSLEQRVCAPLKGIFGTACDEFLERRESRGGLRGTSWCRQIYGSEVRGQTHDYTVCRMRGKSAKWIILTRQ